jgi:hypothetical protein
MSAWPLGHTPRPGSCSEPSSDSRPLTLTHTRTHAHTQRVTHTTHAAPRTAASTSSTLNTLLGPALARPANVRGALLRVTLALMHHWVLWLCVCACMRVRGRVRASGVACVRVAAPVSSSAAETASEVAPPCRASTTGMGEKRFCLAARQRPSAAHTTPHHALHTTHTHNTHTHTARTFFWYGLRPAIGVTPDLLPTTIGEPVAGGCGVNTGWRGTLAPDAPAAAGVRCTLWCVCVRACMCLGVCCARGQARISRGCVAAVCGVCAPGPAPTERWHTHAVHSTPPPLCQHSLL